MKKINVDEIIEDIKRQQSERKRHEPTGDQHDTMSVQNFYAYMPMHNYIYAPTRETWPASSVNARIPPITGANGKPISASAWIDKNQPVEQLSWIPGEPMLIKGRLISEGGWIEHKGSTVFNLYRAPTIAPGDPEQAKQWIDHIEMIYPDDAAHIIRWLAHRVQRPGEKINSPRVMQMVEKAAAAVGGVTSGMWGSELAYIEPASRGFLALLPPYSAFDRLAADKAFTPMPLHTRLGVAGPSASMASSVGENVLKPMMSLATSAEIMPVQKVGATVAYTKELQVATQGSVVSDLFQSMMANAVAKETDRKFLEIFEDTNISSSASTGSDASAILADIGTAVQSIDIGVGSRLYFIASPSVIANVAIKLAVNGTAPNLGVSGGSFLGLTFVRSDAATSDAIVLDATAVGADPGIAINRQSRQTSLIMDDAPSGYNTVSLFQTNQIAERVERYFGACILKPQSIAIVSGMGSTA